MDLYLREQGENQSTRGKPPDKQSENRHHILEVKIHRPNRGSNHHTLNLVLSLLGQNMLALSLTH